MKASQLSTVSKFGKFYTKQEQKTGDSPIIKTIQLKQNLAHKHPIIQCKLDQSSKLAYLLDSSGSLIYLNLQQNSISSIQSPPISHFIPSYYNPYFIHCLNSSSQLFNINPNKSITKRHKFHLNKIIRMERNYLTEWTLLIQRNFIVLYRHGQIKTLKSQNGEIFTNGTFSADSRYLILAIKNVEIRIVEIRDFKIVHKIKLPFQISDLKIQVSYDCKDICIYGKCHILFFISFSSSLNFHLSYQLVQLPYQRQIKKAQYLFNGQLILLSSNQIIYIILSSDRTKLIPICNQQDRIAITTFQVALDMKRMVVVAGRKVMVLQYKAGIGKYITKTKAIQIKWVHSFANGQSKTFIQPNIQYDQEEQSEANLNQHQYKNDQGQIKNGQNINKYTSNQHNNQRSNIQLWEKASRLQNNQILNGPFSQVHELLNQKSSSVLNNDSEQKYQTLQELIAKQQRIKKQLKQLYDVKK